MARNISVMGIYPDRTTVSDAISVLQKTGYRATDISVLSSDNQGSKDFAHEKRTKALEGAATGAAAGAVVGAALAWFVSIQTVTITVLASLVAAGPVLAAVAGAGAGGALGWIVGLLAGLRVTEYVAKRYAGRIRRWRHSAVRSLRQSGVVRPGEENAERYRRAEISPPLRSLPPTTGRRISRPRGRPRWSPSFAARPRRQQVVEPVAHETKK